MESFEADRWNKMKTKYFFLHIPKSGGTTLNHILDKRFRKSEQYMYSTLNPGVSMQIVRNIHRERLNKLKLIKGHFVFGFHEWLKIKNPIYFTVMRNPIDRVISHYFYSARKKDHYLYEKRKSSDINIEEYIREVCPEARNGVSKQIAGYYVNDNFGYGKNIDRCEDQETLYEVALDNIKNNFAMVGITESFDKSLFFLNRILGGKRFNYYYYKRNINKDREQNKHYYISERDKQLIQEFNKADVKLYNYCKTKFDKECEKAKEGKKNFNYEVSNIIFKWGLDLYRKTNRFL